MAFAEVEKALDNPMRTYSSGMQMRLAFSVAVHTEPEILLIDEVLSVGDIAFQRKCMDRIAEFRAAGCSILLVSHEGSVVQDLCDEAVWLSGGRLMAQGDAADVVRQYAAHMGSGEPPLTESTARRKSDPYPVASPTACDSFGPRVAMRCRWTSSVSVRWNWRSAPFGCSTAKAQPVDRGAVRPAGAD